jgi:hypothetical protein
MVTKVMLLLLLHATQIQKHAFVFHFCRGFQVNYPLASHQMIVMAFKMGLQYVKVVISEMIGYYNFILPAIKYITQQLQQQQQLTSLIRCICN